MKDVLYGENLGLLRLVFLLIIARERDYQSLILHGLGL